MTPEAPAASAAGAGDESAFATLVGRHRRELHVHCYRMLGNFEEAEDAVQETFLRAWNRRDTFAGGGYRARLYRLAPNARLDAVRRRARRAPAQNPSPGPRPPPGPGRPLGQDPPRGA